MVRGDGDDVINCVRDTGRGISEKQLEHLFDPYYQAARGDHGIGTGLGLSIIKHLAELHGGSIAVESVPGTGSVFMVRLPKSPTDKLNVAAPATSYALQETTAKSASSRATVGAGS